MADVNKTAIFTLEIDNASFNREIVDATKQIQDLTREKIKYLEKQKLGIELTDEEIITMKKLDAAIAANKKVVADNTKILQKQTEASLAQQGSQKQLMAQYEAASLELKRLGGSFTKATDGTLKLTNSNKELAAETNAVFQKLKEYDAALGKHNLNVGNYGGVLTQLKQKIQELDQQRSIATDPDEVLRLTSEMRKATFEMDKMTGKVDAMGNRVAKNDIKDGFQDATSAVGALGGALSLLSLTMGDNEEASANLQKAVIALTVAGGALNIVKNKQDVIDAALLVKTKLQTAAQWALNNATKAFTAIGIVGILAGLVALVSSFTKRTNEMSDEMADANKEILEQKIRLTALVEIAKNTNESLAKRRDAIKQINEISPEYLGNIQLETINTLEASKAIDTYLDTLKRKAEAEATFNLLVKKTTELVNLRDEIGDGPNFVDLLLGGASGGTSLTGKAVELQNLQKEIDDLAASYTKLTANQLGNAVTEVMKEDKKEVIKGNAESVTKLATAVTLLTEAQKRELNAKMQGLTGAGGMILGTSEEIAGRARSTQEQARQQAVLNDRLKKEAELRQETLELIEKQKQAAAAMSDVIGNVFSGMLATAEDQQKEFYKNALLGLLDYLEKFLTVKIAETFINEVSSKSFAGVITASILTGLMKAALNGVRGSINGYAEGGLIEDAHGVPIQRSNGDNRLVTVKTGEVVMNEVQQAELKQQAGVDIFKRLRVPGFATGGLVLGDGGMQSRAMVSKVNNSFEIRQMVVEAMRSMPNPIVEVTEINAKQAGYRRAEVMSSL